jgi:Trypsin-like peptidase domain
MQPRRVATAVVALALLLAACAPAVPQHQMTSLSSATQASPSATSVSPTPRTVQEVIAALRPLVVRIETWTCDSGGSFGSGYLLDATHVVTVAHNVVGARTGTNPGYEDIAVRSIDRGVVKAKVIGIDTVKDVALLQLKDPLLGPGAAALTFAITPAVEGDAVIALGYPGARPLSSLQGHVSGLNRTQTVEDKPISGLLQFDAQITQGNSGGPLVSTDGQVVGLVDSGGIRVIDGQAQALWVPTGQNYAVTDVRTSINRWMTTPAPPPASSCTFRYALPIAVNSTHPEATGIAATIAYWLTPNGYTTLSGNALAHAVSKEAFEQARASETLSDVTLSASVNWKAETTDAAEVTYRSQSATGCQLMHLRLTLSTEQGLWTISDVIDAEPPRTC